MAYTLADFRSRLARAGPQHARSLVLQNESLFRQRSDLLAPTLATMPWATGCAILQAMNTVDNVPLESFRACLARMSQCSNVEAVDWTAALNCLRMAESNFPRSVPSRAYLSALRVLATAKEAKKATELIRICAERGQLRESMVNAAAISCESSEHWAQGMKLIASIESRSDQMSQQRRLVAERLLRFAPWDVALSLGAAGRVRSLPPNLPLPSVVRHLQGSELDEEAVMDLIERGAGSDDLLGLGVSNRVIRSQKMQEALLRAAARSGAWARGLEVFADAPPESRFDINVLSECVLHACRSSALSTKVISRLQVDRYSLRPEASRALRTAVMKSAGAGDASWVLGISVAVSVCGRARITSVDASQMISLCVRAGAHETALNALKFTRRSKVELEHDAQLEALLFSFAYGRYREARHIVEEAKNARGEKFAKPLQLLLNQRFAASVS